MIGSIDRLKSPLNFFLNQILICHWGSQTFDLYHIFKDLLDVFML
jgi:hypothetical protein